MCDDDDRMNSNPLSEIENSQFLNVFMMTMNEILSSSSSSSSSPSSSSSSSHHHEHNLLDLLCQIENLICFSFDILNFSEISKISIWKYFQEMIISARTESCSNEMMCALKLWQEFVSHLMITTKDDGEREREREGSDHVLFINTTAISEKILRFSAYALLKKHLSSSSSSSSSNFSHFELETEIVCHLVDHYQTPRGLARSIAQEISQGSYTLNPIPSNIHLDHILFQSLPQEDYTPLDNLQDLTEEALTLISMTPMGTSCHEFCQWSSSYGPFLTTTTQDDHHHPMTVMDFILDHHSTLLALHSDITYVPIKNDAYPVLNQLPTVDQLLITISSNEWYKISGYLLATLTGVTNLIEFTATLKALLLILYETIGWNSLVQLVISTVFLLPEGHELQRRGLELYFHCIAHCCDIDLSTAQTKLMDSLINEEEKEEEEKEEEEEEKEMDRRNQSTNLNSLIAAKKLFGIALMNRSSMIWQPLCSYRSMILEKYQTAIQKETIVPIEQMVPQSVLVEGEEKKVQQERSKRQILSDSTCLINDSSPLTTLPLQESTSSAYEVIHNLLVKDFGYTNEGQRPTNDNPVTSKLKNALEHLSTSLYGSDVHFVMELVQNADDNIYEHGIKPTIKFQLYPHSIVVSNNERGFQKENIIAICGVGGSTKKGLTGYIGQKGIG
jgi:hypothetical protein